MSMTASVPLSVGDAASELGCREWHLRALFKRKLVPEPARVGVFRLIDVETLPELRRALVAAGYLPGETRKG